MTETTFKCAFALDAETQTFKPAAHNLNPSQAVEQFNTDNAKIVDQTGRHRNPNPQKCQACRKIAEELTSKHVGSSAPSAQAGPEAASAQESESD